MIKKCGVRVWLLDLQLDVCSQILNAFVLESCIMEGLDGPFIQKIFILAPKFMQLFCASLKTTFW